MAVLMSALSRIQAPAVRPVHLTPAPVVPSAVSFARARRPRLIRVSSAQTLASTVMLPLQASTLLAQAPCCLEAVLNDDLQACKYAVLSPGSVEADSGQASDAAPRCVSESGLRHPSGHELPDHPILDAAHSAQSGRQGRTTFRARPLSSPLPICPLAHHGNRSPRSIISTRPLNVTELSWRSLRVLRSPQNLRTSPRQ